MKNVEAFAKPHHTMATKCNFPQNPQKSYKSPKFVLMETPNLYG